MGIQESESHDRMRILESVWKEDASGKCGALDSQSS